MQSLFRLARNILVARRTTAILLPLIAVIILLSIFAAISVIVMSVLRAYVGGESHWSKAQKDAIYALQRFAATGAEPEYQRFLKEIDVPLGDRRARLELDKPDPDYAVVQEGFVAGGVAADDIASMSWMYRNYKNLPLFRNAISYWEQGDYYILKVHDIGLSLRELELAGQRGSSTALSAVAELQSIDSLLAPVEDGYALSLSEASRQIKNMLLVALIVGALLLLFACTWYSRRSYERSHRLQAQLRQSEERLSLGFAGSNAGLWDWDIVNGQVFYSPWINQQLGYSGKEMSSAPSAFVDLIHPDDRQMAQDALRRHLVANTMYDIEFRVKTMTGDYIWCKSRAQAIRSEEGVAVRMVGSLFDVTDRKMAEAKAFAEKELAEVTLASIADAVITTDNLGRISYCNKIAEQMLGLSREDMLTQPFDAVCKIFDEKNHEHVPDFLEQVMWPETGTETTNDLYLLGVDGSNIPIDRSIAPIRNPDGNVIGIVIVLHDVSEVRRHAAQLSYQATHDELTGILNRREFERRLSELIAKEPVDEEYEEHAVMYLDLDRFKIINDTSGHAAGDELIRQVSHMLKHRLRDGDMVGRLGGDEFGVVLAHCSKTDACRLAEVLRQSVADIRFAWGGRAFEIGVSVGLVVLAPGMISLKEVMKAADAACYMAKEKGRNRIHLFSHDDEDLSVRHNEMEWVSRIKAALDQDRFCLYTQKIQSLHAEHTGEGEHVEILLRMLDEEYKIIPPMAFIPSAERFDLMPQIDRWVIRKSFSALATLCKDGGAAIDTWAINLSGASIGDDRLLDYVIEQQQASGITFSKICFEITETAAIANLQKAVTLINRLRGLGCRFALDDFGVGMSSFSYLKHLPVDYLKIDGSFIKEIVNSPTDRAMVESINQIGHVMGKQTIAEFVEDDAIIACLKQIGIDYAQGYGIGRPQPLPPQAFASKHVERMEALLSGTRKIA
ncbi:EAL domain-containing protein [Undibacterium sp. TJN25]|uniref:EAL domain-containing protein n=1 Tax=Undibacterium sp. TJN25 TaxID=3413056 RepID=UPI003BF27A96